MQPGCMDLCRYNATKDEVCWEDCRITLSLLKLHVNKAFFPRIHRDQVLHD